MSSNLGPHKTLPGFGAYGASKAALSALTKSAEAAYVVGADLVIDGGVSL